MDNIFILTPYFLDDYIPALASLSRAGWQVVQRWLPPVEKQLRMTELYQVLRERVTGVVRRGQRPVSIAGDCCTTLAVMAGLQRARIHPTLIWLDAHGDFNTWETTPSGFLGGMPLAMLVGRGEQTIAAGVTLETLPESQVILADGRDLDPEEGKALRTSAVRLLEDVTYLLEMELPRGPLYVHFDADVLNPDEAPAMSYPAVGGPSIETMRVVMRHLASTGQVAAVSVSCWNPDMDQDGQTSHLVMDLVTELVA